MTTAIQASGIRRTYGRLGPDETVAVDNVDLRFEIGEAIGIVGESGSGKTTLARILTGLETPTAGTVLVNNRPIPSQGKAWRQRRREIQLIPQHSSGALDPRVTIGRHLTEVLDAHNICTRAEQSDLIARRLADVGLAEQDLGKYPRQLSGGQQQRLVIARALLLDPPILVCDEPTSALDLLVQTQVVDLLKRTCCGPDRLFVIITHDLRMVDGLCDRLIVMKNGAIVEQGEAGALLNRPQHPYTNELVRSAFEYSIDDLDPIAEQ
jgi:peptide/nickel transport system ATP-binding protein